jgi:hypothetical protein
MENPDCLTGVATSQFFTGMARAPGHNFPSNRATPGGRGASVASKSQFQNPFPNGNSTPEWKTHWDFHSGMGLPIRNRRSPFRNATYGQSSSTPFRNANTIPEWKSYSESAYLRPPGGGLMYPPRQTPHSGMTHLIRKSALNGFL